MFWESIDSLTRLAINIVELKFPSEFNDRRYSRPIFELIKLVGDEMIKEEIDEAIKYLCMIPIPFISGNRDCDIEESQKYSIALNMAIKALKQEHKQGRWILIDKELSRYKCSECGEIIKLHKKSEISKLEKDETLFDYPFSHCGARMIKSQEREE